MFTLEPTNFIAGVVTGVVVGTVSTLILGREHITLEKRASLLIVGVWITLHIGSFLLDKSVPYLFDFGGLGAAGVLVGIDYGAFISKVLKKQ